MDMVPVDYDGPAPAMVAESTIQASVAAAGFTPPASYVRFARDNGGKRFPSDRRYVRNQDSGEIVGITTVYHYDEKVPLYSTKDIWEQTSGELPAGLLPIASTEFSGEVCLDYRQSPERPRVVLFDYEADPGAEIGLFATDFDAFLAAIGPNPER